MWPAGQRGRSCYSLVLTWPFPLPYTLVMYHITRPWSERFQNGRWLGVKKKKPSKIWFCTMYCLFAHLGFFHLREIHRDKKGGEICRQLHCKVPMTWTFLFCIFWLIAAFRKSPPWPLFCAVKVRFCSSGIWLLYGILLAARRRSRGEWTEQNLLTL